MDLIFISQEYELRDWALITILHEIYINWKGQMRDLQALSGDNDDDYPLRRGLSRLWFAHWT